MLVAAPVRAPGLVSMSSSPGAPTSVLPLRTDVREVRLARLDKTRPVVILTRAAAREAMTKVTVAPITSTVKGLSSEVPVGPAEGLDHACAISLDNVLTIPSSRLGRTLGLLGPAQEKALARAIVLAYDLDLFPAPTRREAPPRRATGRGSE